MERERVLLVEDHSVNRVVIRKLLSGDYELVEAENGQAALDLLQKEHPRIDGIILDLIMPVMSGREFLEIYAQTPAYINIPVLVATAAQTQDEEKECLRLGAWDFIRKPIDGDLLKLRLKNIIGRSQNALNRQIRHMAEHDALTGLYNRSYFLTATRQLLDQTDRPYALMHMDIKRFRLVNSFFGSEAGDKLLCFLSKQMHDLLFPVPRCTLGRMEADVFCACVPLDDEQINSMAEQIQSTLTVKQSSYYLELSFGVYHITNRTMPVETMCDHAAEAARHSKNSYRAPVCYYQKSMSNAAIQEQRIMSEAQTALDEEQFEVYLQPKYDLIRKCAYGAEVLARWNHPTRGLISPGNFIPVFEKNGFVAKLDFYMWEHTCKLLRRWADAGLNPAPVSVNISRVNMYNPHLADIMKALVRRSGIPPRLLNLELTESAYMDNPEQMKRMVQKLKRAGFLIMMDDFGSGYSSLNTLKDLPIDVLKIDMRFLPASRNDSRSERILASVIRMAGWLGLAVIVEGVETKEQLDFLESVGCGYVQGYYFARPMPSREYEKTLETQSLYPVIAPAGTASQKSLLELIWSSDAEVSRLFDAMLTPVAIFEYGNGICDPIRVNAEFRRVFGLVRQHLAGESGVLSDEDKAQILSAFDQAAVPGGEAQTVFAHCSADGSAVQYQLRLKYLQSSGNGALLAAVFIEWSKSYTVE